MYELTRSAMLEVMPRAAGVIDEWLKPLQDAANAFDITTRARAMMWVANIAHESAELTQLEENLNYAHAERLMAVYPRRIASLAQAHGIIAGGPEAVANFVYASREGNGDEASGDGWRYRGRGPNGLTFRSNYRACSIAICGDADTLLTNPEFVALPDFGAAAAGWHWQETKCSESADEGDFDGVCDKVNLGRKTTTRGDSNGFADREHYYNVCDRVFA